MIKHRLKGLLRDAWALGLYHTGLWRVADRLAPRRLLVLAGHCVEDPAVNGDLPADMRISRSRLTQLLRALTSRFEAVTVDEGWQALQTGSGRSMVALSLDDGYRDNLTVLPAVLEETGARATVYLESRALLERRPNWSHGYFWLLAEGGLRPVEVARAYMAHADDEDACVRLEQLLLEERASAYQVKRVLKYQARREERDRVLGQLVQERGGDLQALCERIHLTVAEADEAAAAGLELGGHTRTHEVLSTLDAEEQAAEIEGGREDLARSLAGGAPTTFAYPFGRRWDFDGASEEAARRAGYCLAVTTHAGVVTADSPAYRLPRLMIDEDTSIPQAVVQAAGGYLLLERLGLHLLE